MGFLDSILFLVAIVIGGLATILGSIFGALFLTFQGELISNLADVIPQAEDLRGVIYGSLLIVVMIFFPRGLAGFVRSLPGWSPTLGGQHSGVVAALARLIRPGHGTDSGAGRSD